MRLAHAPQQRLAGLLVALDDQRGILGLQPLERTTELVVVGLGARPHGHAEDGRRGSAGHDPHGRSLGASVSPVRVPASLATAAMSPAMRDVAVVWSLPRRWNSPWRRSSVPLVALTRWSSVLMVPDSTLNTDSWPTNGSAIVRKT